MYPVHLAGAIRASSMQFSEYCTQLESSLLSAVAPCLLGVWNPKVCIGLAPLCCAFQAKTYGPSAIPSLDGAAQGGRNRGIGMGAEAEVEAEAEAGEGPRHMPQRCCTPTPEQGSAAEALL